MAIREQTWTQAQKDAVKKLHRLGVWREVSVRQDDRDPDDRGFNSIYFDVDDEVDLHYCNSRDGWDNELVLSDREYRSASKWLREYKDLVDNEYEKVRCE